MKTLLLFFILFPLSFVSYGQQIDSIKYDHGFLYYHEYGKGETVILLSGGPGNYCMQIEDIALKLKSNYRIILLEQRGTGLSIPSPVNSETINLKAAIGDINRLLDHLHLEQAIICGHSYGSALAMFFASAHPQRVKALILIGPAYLTVGDEMPQTLVANLHSRWGTFEINRMDTLWAKSEKGNLTNDEILEQSKIRRMAFIFDKLKIDSLYPRITVQNFGQMGDLINEDWEQYNFNLKSLSNFSKPIFIICGRQDLLAFMAYELKIALPSIKLYWIQECGHFPMYEKPVEFYSILNSVLSDIK